MERANAKRIDLTSPEGVEETFKYHQPPDEATKDAHAEVRKACGDAARKLISLAKGSPELTLAVRHLQQAMFFGNAAIAIYGIEPKALSQDGG